MFDGLTFDARPFGQDVRGPAERRRRQGLSTSFDHEREEELRAALADHGDCGGAWRAGGGMARIVGAPTHGGGSSDYRNRNIVHLGTLKNARQAMKCDRFLWFAEKWPGVLSAGP